MTKRTVKIEIYRIWRPDRTNAFHTDCRKAWEVWSLVDQTIRGATWCRLFVQLKMMWTGYAFLQCRFVLVERVLVGCCGEDLAMNIFNGNKMDPANASNIILRDLTPRANCTSSIAHRFYPWFAILIVVFYDIIPLISRNSVKPLLINAGSPRLC